MNYAEIRAYFNAQLVFKQTCGACLLKIISLKWQSPTDNRWHAYGNDVYIAWNKDNAPYSNVWAGGKSQRLNQFANIKSLSDWIDLNHTM